MPVLSFNRVMKTNANGVESFETERLIGREWRVEDVEAAFAMYGDPEVMRGLAREPEPDLDTQRENLLAAIERYRVRPKGMGFWALERKTDGRIVGTAVVKELPNDEEKVEVGWHLAREFWGNGYATEAAREAIATAFRHLPIERIYALVMPWNERSLRITERLGFTRGEATNRYYDAELIVHWLERSTGVDCRRP